MGRMILVTAMAALVVAPAVGDAAGAKRGKACPDGAVCLWSKSNYRGDREVIDKKGATNVSKALNNKASSVKNRGGGFAYLMDAKNGSSNDDYQCMFEDEYPSLRDIGFNNRISSVLRPRPGDPKLIC